MTCPDCAGRPCVFHLLVAGGRDDPQRQAVAMAIAPDAFTKAHEAHRYFTLHHPERERKFDPWTARDLREAYAAADRVILTLGTRP